MRFIIIEPKLSNAFHFEQAGSLTEDRIRDVLKADYLDCVELADDMDMWIRRERAESDKPFRIKDGQEVYLGDALLAGRSRFGEIMPLHRKYEIERVIGWLQFPDAASVRRVVPSGVYHESIAAFA